jgi:hypothetical protein
MIKSVEVFLSEYENMHPKASRYISTTASDLSYTFFLIECWWDNANLTYKDFLEERSQSFSTPDEAIDAHKIFWLFNGLSFTDFYDHIQALVITTNDTDLTEFDYAVLIYASLQDDDTRQTFENLPLSLLHDVFTPVAEAKLADWKSR